MKFSLVVGLRCIFALAVLTFPLLPTANIASAQPINGGTPAQPSEAPAQPAATSFTQLHIVWTLPQLQHDISFTGVPQGEEVLNYDKPTSGLLGAARGRAQVGPKGFDTYPLWDAWCVPTMADDGSISLSASAIHKDDPATTTQVTVTASQASEGIVIGTAKVKITSKTVAANEPPIIDKIWGLLVSHDGSSDVPTTLPTDVLHQAALALGFTPVVLAATEISDQTPRLEATNGSAKMIVIFGSGYSGNIGGDGIMNGFPPRGGAPRGAVSSDPNIMLKEGAVLLGGNYQTMTLPSPAQPNYSQIHFVYSESSGTRENEFSLTSALWVGAPVIAGPLQANSNDTYVVCIATAKADPAHAKQVLAGIRTWTARTGQTTRATFVKEDNGRVTLHKEDGTEVTLALSILSDGDIELIKEAANTAP